MEDKKTSVKDKIKEFAIDCGPAVAAVLVSYGVGVILGTKVYKKGFYAGRGVLASTIVEASNNNGGLLLTNDILGDYIFKATKVLEK